MPTPRTPSRGQNLLNPPPQRKNIEQIGNIAPEGHERQLTTLRHSVY
jgi:hypothetical protein